MSKKKETACKGDPGRFLASGSVKLNYITIFMLISQVRRIIRRRAKALIVSLALWELLPISWADKLVEGLKA